MDCTSKRPRTQNKARIPGLTVFHSRMDPLKVHFDVQYLGCDSLNYGPFRAGNPAKSANNNLIFFIVFRVWAGYEV